MMGRMPASRVRRALMDSGLGILILAMTSSCGSDTPSCRAACDHLYACLPETTAPKDECVRKCETDAGKGTAENRSCIVEKSCDDLRHGKCPDLIVR